MVEASFTLSGEAADGARFLEQPMISDETAVTEIKTPCRERRGAVLAVKGGGELRCFKVVKFPRQGQKLLTVIRPVFYREYDRPSPARMDVIDVTSRIRRNRPWD